MFLYFLFDLKMIKYNETGQIIAPASSLLFIVLILTAFHT
jgi:hypothetical protein